MVARYFAYGSNMNPDRVRERGINFDHAVAAALEDFALVFDKTSRAHAGLGHANVVPARGEAVEGVLYWLAGTGEIGKMDRFESTPVNYSREVVHVRVDATDIPPEHMSAAGSGGTLVTTWTYFANPAVRRAGLLPPRSYLNHLLAGRPFLSERYYDMLASWPCEEDR